MKKQMIEIEVPDGKKAVWKDGKVVLEDIEPQLPNTWEEFCKNYPIKSGEFLIDSLSQILALGFRDRDIYRPERTAELQSSGGTSCIYATSSIKKLL